MVLAAAVATAAAAAAAAAAAVVVVVVVVSSSSSSSSSTNSMLEQQFIDMKNAILPAFLIGTVSVVTASTYAVFQRVFIIPYVIICEIRHV